MVENNSRNDVSWFDRVRNQFARTLGIHEESKGDIYLQISRSATLNDLAYWLQVLLSAGIATLGLILNSPAVIIGAMLISPLMGPILASGLTLATGDLILGARAVANLVLSCLIAILFAVLLVSVLPFKETTSEIAARTQPNTLDLVIALFSGAIGSIAICKEVKGVVTSIPGVAIAVALMPPLCVAGFGLGVTLSQDPVEGMRVARGGALLFLTNLIAITFTAMVVFVILHIDTPGVRAKVAEWRAQHPESLRFQHLLSRMPSMKWLTRLDSLPGRFLLIVITLAILLVPLSRTFDQLRREIAHKKGENELRRAATEVWEANFSRFPTGEPRAYLGQMSVLEQYGTLTLSLRVFTSKPYSAEEKAEFNRLLASKLGRPVQSITVQLIEIPTATSELQARNAPAGAGSEGPPVILSLEQLQQNYSQRVRAALRDLDLPGPARFINYRLSLVSDQAPDLKILYLSDREIDPDAKSLITAEVRKRLEDVAAVVQLVRIPAKVGLLDFVAREPPFTPQVAAILDPVGESLRDYPNLLLEIDPAARPFESEDVRRGRGSAIMSYFATKFGIATERMSIGGEPPATRETTLLISIKESGPPE